MLIIFPLHFHVNILSMHTLSSISLTLLRVFCLNLGTYFYKNLISFFISSLSNFYASFPQILYLNLCLFFGYLVLNSVSLLLLWSYLSTRFVLILPHFCHFVIAYVLPSSELISVLMNIFTSVCAHFDLLFELILTSVFVLNCFA